MNPQIMVAFHFYFKTNLSTILKHTGEAIVKVGILKETARDEKRVVLVPDDVAKLVGKGAVIKVERDAGSAAGHSNDAYSKAGAEIVDSAQALCSESAIVLRVNRPTVEEIKSLKKGCIHISLLDPYLSPEITDAMADQGVSAFSLEMIPRSTYSQKMDVLSSQANLAGYVAVIQAAAKLTKIFPMMMTPSGSIQPARVFVLGAGVAGLQAIATAKRLGARVTAFDIRPEAIEQIESLGAKALKIDMGETSSTKDGYAKEISEEQKEKQKKAMTKTCGQSNIVITTAQVFGRKAPVLIDEQTIAAMQPGSIIVDMAVGTGGNVAGSKLDEEVDVNGVTIIGIGNLPGFVATDSSRMFSANIFNFISDFWDEENKTFKMDLENEILAATLITHEGKIVNERVKSAREKS